MTTDSADLERRDRCPVCDSPTGEPFLLIPSVPVHCNVLWSTSADAVGAPRGDMELVLCGTCGHVFNRAFDVGSTTYGATYENSLHHSGAFQSYVAELVEDLVDKYDIRDRDVVEIGAGQGDFLETLCVAGANRGTGFDPSFVAAGDVSERVRVVAEFYDERFISEPADVVLCRHVLEHIEDSGAFVSMVRRVIGERSSVAVFEVPDAAWTFRHDGIWDLIYEHCGYFSEESLRWAFAHSGFGIEHVRSVFGNQFLVLEALPADGPTELPADFADRVGDLVTQVADFSGHYGEIIDAWSERLAELADAGRTAALWGAGSKGVSFLNVVTGAEVVDRAVDINPRKRGMRVSGSGQCIVAPQDLVDDPTDVVIVMNQNYVDEIRSTLDGLGLSPEIMVV